MLQLSRFRFESNTNFLTDPSDDCIWTFGTRGQQFHTESGPLRRMDMTVF